MKFKVGNKVRILNKSHCPDCWDKCLKKMGRIGFITEIFKDYILVNKTMKEDNNWTFLEKDLILFSDFDKNPIDKLKRLLDL